MEFDYRAPTDETASSLFGSLLRPYWRESEAQLTEKQAVLLMHDIYIQILVFEMSQEMVKIHVALDMIDVCLPLLVC